MEANVDTPLQAQHSTGKDGTPPSPELRSSSTTRYGVERCVVLAAPSCAVAYLGLSTFSRALPSPQLLIVSLYPTFYNFVNVDFLRFVPLTTNH